MNQLLTLIKKDIASYIKDPKSLIILFVLPILLLAISVQVFASGQTEFDVGICHVNNSGDIVQNYTTLLEDFDDSLNLINGSCSDLQKKMHNGVIPLYFITYTQPNLGENVSVTIRVDSTNSMLSYRVKSHIQSTIDRYEASQSRLFISESWGALQEMSRKIATDVDSFSVDGLNASFGGVNSQMERLNTFGDILEDAEDQLQQTQEALWEYNDEIAKTIDDVDSVKRDLEDTEQKLSELSNDVDSIYNALNCESIDTSQCEELEDIQDDIDEEQQKIRSYQQDLSDTKSELKQAQRNIKDARKDVIEMKNDVRTGQRDVGAARSDLQQTQERIDDANKQISGVLEDAEKMKDDISSLNDQGKSAREVISQITTLEATDILRPLEVVVTEYPKPLRQEETLLPGVMVILSYFTMTLLTSISVIREREKGLLRVIYNTGVSIHEYLGSKIISTMFLFLLQIFLIMSVSIVGFGLILPTSIALVMFFAVFLGMVFATAGTTIGFISKSVQGSVFVSLLFILPSLLLQGLFVPLEVMSPSIQSLVLFIPSYAAQQLSLSIFFLQDVSLYGVGLLVLFAAVMYTTSVWVSEKKVVR